MEPFSVLAVILFLFGLAVVISTAGAICDEKRHRPAFKLPIRKIVTD